MSALLNYTLKYSLQNTILSKKISISITINYIVYQSCYINVSEPNVKHKICGKFPHIILIFIIVLVTFSMCNQLAVGQQMYLDHIKC